ncbi:HlyD family secretion protein [Enterovibrio sp. ZSDZ35]|uniref:HlyD family secretion protein n=1 Tax=Enterovibrio qingdaonensis TaxID=2899818 RepID=A0ABT5QJ13_9GAMM|nr:HlyD family efflux transporter periplasmic adaptor subunit [Enterovibrio sp. ZSDZ35]MDD1780972.1 HlyD family secretion protein [Enterovibrio sp. ZSDZ35]
MRSIYRESYKPTEMTTDGLLDTSNDIKSLPLTILTIVLTITVCVFFIDYQRVIDTQGYLVSDKGVVRVFGEQGLVVDKLHIQENDYVSLGDNLVEFKRSIFNAEGKDVLRMKYNINQSALSSLQEEISSTEELYVVLKKKLLERIEKNEREINIIQDEMKLTVENVDIVDDKIAMYEELQKNKHMSKVSLLDQKSLKVNLLSRLKQLERDVFSITKENEILNTEIEELEKSKVLSISQLKRDVSELEIMSAEFGVSESSIIKSPSAGVVTMLNTNVGYEVDGLPLFTIIPKGSVLYAEIYLPSEKISWVEVGDEMDIKYHSFPYEKFGKFKGVITKISPVPVPFTQLSEMAKETLELNPSSGYYKLTARIEDNKVYVDGHDKTLSPSMAFNVSIKGDIMKLYEWLLLSDK